MSKTDKHFNELRLPAMILTAALVLSACNLPGSQAASTQIPALPFPTALATGAPVLASSTPMVIPPTSAPAATATSLPPTAVPTAVPPQPNAIPGAVRVNFATGATAGIVQGQIQPGHVVNYLVGASRNQPLIISADSPNHDVTFSVLGLKDGLTLLPASQQASSWQTMLTVSQDYLVQVIAGASQENFTLNIITPARVNFDPGTDTTLLKGTTPGGWNVSYVLRASAGQRMDLNLYAPAGNAVLSIYGYQDGQPYLRYVVEQTTFGMKLPATQDYIIQVVPRAGAVASYSLSITIN